MTAFATQLLALSTGVLLVTAVILVWQRTFAASVRVLAVQGAALAFLVVAIGLLEAEAELYAVAAVVFVLKAVGIPWVLGHGIRLSGSEREEAPLLNPPAGLVLVALLTTLAYLVSGPIVAATGGLAAEEAGPAAFSAPVGITMVLIGFLLLTTRRRAISQMVGFLVLDNGIATVGFLTAAGVPFVVELGVSLDVLLIALILVVLTGRMGAVLGTEPVSVMRELRD